MSLDEVYVTRTANAYAAAIQVDNGKKAWLTHDEAIELASEIISIALHRCSPELRQKFQNLVRDICK